MVNDPPSPSTKAIEDADRDPNEFSGHGAAIGTAGFVPPATTPDMVLTDKGDKAVVDPAEHGYAEIKIGLAWDDVTGHGVDLDLGVLYELQDGRRGAVQAFGERFGAFNDAPYISLSGDDRMGDAPGDDEIVRINGAQWGQVRRLLVYIYIYDGVKRWAEVKPRVTLHVPGHEDIVAVPAIDDAQYPVCAVAGLENVRGGIKIDYYGEYFPGHLEMDRAFGFGVAWEDGRKDSEE